MNDVSKSIRWADKSLNPVIGCTYGCDFCYARRMNNRFGWIEDFSKPQFFPERLEQLKSKKPKNIFMDSMSDIADWKDEWVEEVFKAIEKNPQHNYLFLTKRPYIYERLKNLFHKSNVWCGATAIDKFSCIMNDCLLDKVHDCNTFLSIEPLLEEVGFGLGPYVDWVIVGAETGNRKGKVKPELEWIEKIVWECDNRNIPVFMKDSLLPIVGERNMRRELPEGLKK